MPATNAVAVSAIIPMRNEETHIEDCIRSLLATQLHEDCFELLVLDGGSSDRSRAIVTQLAMLHPSIRIVDNPGKIVSTAVNIGLIHARGRVIVVIGAHAEYPRNYLGMCLAELERSGAHGVGGHLVTKPGANSLTAQAIALIFQNSFGVGGSTFRTTHEDRYVDTVPYGAYRREVFDSVGPFNETLIRNQDFEFNARVNHAELKLFLSHKLQVTYYSVATVRRLIAQAFGNGYWLPRMWMAYPASFRIRHAAPVGFVSVLLIASLAAWVSIAAALVGGSIFLAYLSLAVIAAAQSARRAGIQFLLPAVCLFFIHHLAYGLGTLSALPALVGPDSSLPGWHRLWRTLRLGLRSLLATRAS